MHLVLEEGESHMLIPESVTVMGHSGLEHCAQSQWQRSVAPLSPTGQMEKVRFPEREWWILLLEEMLGERNKNCLLTLLRAFPGLQSPF